MTTSTYNKISEATIVVLCTSFLLYVFLMFCDFDKVPTNIVSITLGHTLMVIGFVTAIFAMIASFVIKQMTDSVAFIRLFSFITTLLYVFTFVLTGLLNNF
ncbi:hypothetical protein [Parasediminibacterium sp. JCM 36343]|uniref:hypothetical protein n=1 Tax=Parasediminibacterium sp. JCM 36343 TaxID=3374279 RepID=UPI00397D5214